MEIMDVYVMFSLWFHGLLHFSWMECENDKRTFLVYLILI